MIEAFAAPDYSKALSAFGEGDGEYAGLIASAPPSAAPGLLVPDISYMKRYKKDYDILFMHSWPESITEGITNTWDVANFPGVQVPLYAMWQSTVWNDYTVAFTAHCSNPMIRKIASNISNTGSGGAVGQYGSFAAGLYAGALDLLRVQLQVAWCKSIMLPNNKKVFDVAKQWANIAGGGGGEGSALKKIIKGLKDTIKTAEDYTKTIAKEGFYSGALQPPVIETHYGAFLTLYGVPVQCNIVYQRPFTPVLGYPHRADISMGFHRFFPPGVPIPSRTGMLTTSDSDISQFMS